MIQYHSINGQLVPAASAALQVNDLSILRGYGIFDFFGVLSGVPLFFDDYLDRFFRSAGILGLKLPFDRPQVIGAVHDVIRANDMSDGYIRLEVTGGYSPDGYKPGTANWMVLGAHPPKPSDKQYVDGIHLMLYPHQRELPEAKSINYLTGIFLLPMLAEKGADAVLYHDNGWVRESDRSNFFIVTRAGVLVTPREKILAGITRKKVLDLAGPLMATEIREIAVEELKEAEEAFITSTIKGVLPVSSIDNRPVGDGRPGPVSRDLGLRFSELTRNYILQTTQV